MQIRYAAPFREDEAEELGKQRGFPVGIKYMHREMLSITHWCFVPALLCRDMGLETAESYFCPALQFGQAGMMKQVWRLAGKLAGCKRELSTGSYSLNLMKKSDIGKGK